MTKTKLCGIRDLRDVRLMNRYLPDYVGFVLAESRRRVGLDALSGLIGALDPRIAPVGVFVNEEIRTVINAVESGIRVIQLHGEESQCYIDELREAIGEGASKTGAEILLWKAIRLKDQTQLEEAMAFKRIDGLLFDKYSGSAHGGTGEALDWSLLEGVEMSVPLILAGGLSGRNVTEAILRVKPFCVDVSSGIEVDGRKDEELVRGFLQKLEQYYIF